MANIEDVARRAGVSRSTVSYALSGKRSISRETRERIEAAIAELGFTPNAGARALATSRTMVIGLFVQFFEDEFSSAMLQYVLQLNEILDARDESATIVHNDAVIAALPSALYSRGIRVPDDRSVVGVFSEDFGRCSRCRTRR